MAMNDEGMGHVDAIYDWSKGNDNTQRASDILFGISIHSDPTKAQIIDLSYSAMIELSMIVNIGEPLWQPQNHHRHQILNKNEYLRQFGQMDDTLRDIMKLVEVGQPQSLSNLDSYLCQHSMSKVNKNEDLQVEGSRDMEYIKMSASDIVELLMDMNQWSREFFNIVSSTTMVETLLDGAQGSNDGKLHVMSAELHLPTPFAPSRECYFARYCKQLSQHIWGVVDISLEKFFPSPSTNFRKRPSGCIIEAMPNGFSKVIWVEHVEANHDQVNKQFQPLVTSGFAFGATRWLSSIVQHSEWLETLKGPTLVADDGGGRISLLNVADRMMRTFVSDINTSTRNSWIQIPSSPGSADVKFIVKNNSDEIGKPIGTSVLFTTSLWVNASPNQLFNFLRHGSSRKKTSEDKTEIFYIQKSYTDSMASYVIYAPLDESSLKALGKGSNPDIVMILPSGFVICPSGFPRNDGVDKNNGGGSILTIAFHIVESSSIRSIISPESVETLYKVITDTVSAISDAVVYNNMYKAWLM
ncbi:unnamed protein product [Lupinus luteus]|uniref:START domain-containing protein n=1 Tax=Lupinus luteus TaxID=3873 RepID=A0AAV1W0T5_LUPLU